MTIAAAPLVCRYCPRLASGTVSATGSALQPSGRIPHCDLHWDDAYEAVRHYPTRMWRYVEQPAGLF